MAEKDIVPFVAKLMPVLTANIQPATIENVEDYFTTKDFANAIEDHVGVPVDPSVVYTWLDEMGYTFTDTGDMKLRWMIRPRPFGGADNAPASVNEDS